MGTHRPLARPLRIAFVAAAALFAPLALAYPLLCAALFVFATLTARPPASTLWLTLALAGLTTLRAHSELGQYRASWETMRTQFGAPQRCAITGRVLTSPTQRGDTLTFSARLSNFDCEGQRPADSVIARLYGGPPALVRGAAFEGVAQLGVTRLFRNLGESDPVQHYARSGVVLSGTLLAAHVTAESNSPGAWVDRARRHVRERIQATFLGSVAPLARALVLGENDLEPETARAFALSGLSHLLAVSGTHLVFAVVSLVNALEWFLRRILVVAERARPDLVGAGFGAPLALLYADFAGGSGSAWRAAWMLATVYVARLLGRSSTAGLTLAGSVFVGVLAEPLVVSDLSFMLSLAATLGLLTLGRVAARHVNKLSSKPLRLFGAGVLATVASLVPCSLLLAFLTPSLSLFGVIANVFVAPFGEAIALPLCLTHAFLAPWPALERGAALVASGALSVVKAAALQVTTLGQEWPLFSVPLFPPTALQLAVVIAGALAATAALCWRPPKRWIGLVVTSIAALSVIATEARLRTQIAAAGCLRVTIVDVGQGDASLVDLPSGELMIIDGGGFVGSPVDPGARVLLPILRSRRREQIDYMVLSHPHPDHFGGLVTLAQELRVREFWDTGQGERDGAGPDYDALLSALRAQGTRIVHPDALCERSEVGGARLRVFMPCPDLVPGRHANDNSWVFRIEHAGSSILFTGDAELATEGDLVARYREELPAQVLKIGHHGSRTSTTPAFVHAVRPRLATISTGVRNRYGHPHANTLATLHAQGVATLRTDRDGGIELRATGGSWEVTTYRGLERRPLRAPRPTPHRPAIAGL